MRWSEEEYQAYLVRQQERPGLPRPILLPTDMAPESRFQARIITLAKAQGYKAYHTHDSRRSQEGWPDLALAKRDLLLLIEVKTNTGVVKVSQQEWLTLLHNPPYVIAEVWRPAHWQYILSRLGYGGEGWGTSALP